MRTIIRKDCSYDMYGHMIDQIDEQAPYALVEARYNKRLRTAILTFWDSDYIPKEWNEWIVRPSSTKSEKKGVSEEYAE